MFDNVLLDLVITVGNFWEDEGSREVSTSMA